MTVHKQELDEGSESLQSAVKISNDPSCGKCAIRPPRSW